MAVFSGALMIKVALRPDIGHYGFALCLPAIVLGISYVLRVADIDSQIAKERLVFRGLVSTVVLFGVLKLAALSHDHYGRKTYPVGFGSDILLTQTPDVDPRGAAINAMAAAIGESLDAKDSLTVLPEGPFLNFLLAQRSPVALPVVVSPVELRLFGIERMEESLKSAPPTRIVVVSRSVLEHGLPRFGSRPEYGLEIAEWINDNYEKVLQIGADPVSSNGFGAVLYELRKRGTIETQ
jgi:hypothetical protein